MHNFHAQYSNIITPHNLVARPGLATRYITLDKNVPSVISHCKAWPCNVKKEEYYGGMPKRNRVKLYGTDQYYHLYNRGVNKQAIFHKPEDYFYFLSLFKRHLSDERIVDSSKRPYAKFSSDVDLIAFCLMPNHFHLLCYLKQPIGIAKLMQSTLTAYTMYFNKKYKRSGGLYEGPFLASRITNDGYLWHVSRYIHLNPMDTTENYKDYPYSSITYYSGQRKADWLHIERLITTKSEQNQYMDFVSDYETMHNDLKLLKNILAA